jgi:two-component system response regulator FlrC
MTTEYSRFMVSPATKADIVVLGQTASDQELAFSQQSQQTLLSSSLQLIDQAIKSTHLTCAFYPLGEAISDEQLNTRIILFFVSHLETHHLYAQVGALLQSYKNSLVIPIVEYHDQAKAAALLELGCVDFLLAPFSESQCTTLLQRFTTQKPPHALFITQSQAGRRLLSMAQRVATTRAPILITGETGTGKELMARYIHDVSANENSPFVAINCAAIPESMLESLLFGHEKGSFTGAIQTQPGKFELAEGGTLLLDEIGEIPLGLQAKLLRVLQEKTVERLGGRKEIPLNVRIIAATNRDLREEVAEGRFRSDLLFRLDVLPLHIVPLRERTDDILPLAQAFIKKYAPNDSASDVITEDAISALLDYTWPGNVRELENVIQRALILRKGIYIQANDLGFPFYEKNSDNNLSNEDSEKYAAHVTSNTHPQETTFHPHGVGQSNISDSIFVDFEFASPLHGKSALKASGKLAEYQHVINTIQRFGGHKTKAAESLGMSTRALRYRLNAMREQGISLPF